MSAIMTEGLTKRYGRKLALRDVSLSVPRGAVFAYVGRNGAGKTTTIKLLMNLLRPTSGRATVLDTPSTRLGPPQLARIGYVSENQKLPLWMTVGQLVDYCRPMYPTWDDALCDKLRRRFDLSLAAKLSRLSRGMQIKAALLSSLAYRPDLLVLDEPFSGLDPLARDEFVEGLLELADQEQWTVFISSHDIFEVERLADWVGMLDAGELKLIESAASLQERFREIEAVTEGEPTIPAQPPSTWLGPASSGHMLRFVESGYELGRTEAAVRHHLPDVKSIEAKAMSLRAIFLALARQFRASSEKETS